MKKNHPFTLACERCAFLGSFQGADLYFCAKQLGGLTVIARHGNEGPPYVSGIWFAENDVRIKEALLRAQDRLGFQPTAR